jgi:hypothetical protein
MPARVAGPAEPMQPLVRLGLFTLTARYQTQDLRCFFGREGAFSRRPLYTVRLGFLDSKVPTNGKA